jgi:hypothetical protein
MLSIQQAIKDPIKLVNIMKPDAILSPSDISAVDCFVITAAAYHSPLVKQTPNTAATRMMRQGSKVYYRRIV